MHILYWGWPTCSMLFIIYRVLVCHSILLWPSPDLLGWFPWPTWSAQHLFCYHAMGLVAPFLCSCWDKCCVFVVVDPCVSWCGDFPCATSSKHVAGWPHLFYIKITVLRIPTWLRSILMSVGTPCLLPGTLERIRSQWVSEHGYFSFWLCRTPEAS